MNYVIMQCSHEGCPRKKRTPWDEDFPIGTVVVKSRCPWHQDGDFDQEQYFDKDGNELYWKPNVAEI